MNRRQFIELPGALLAAPAFAAGPGDVWHQNIRRVGQVNMTEHDPVSMNVEEWADYWASLKVDVVMVSVTGILAYYPSKVPFHRHGKYLNGRDFFGECCAAAKKRGIRVIARMSPDLQWEEALGPHPEWFTRDAAGKFVPHTEDARLYKTCMFTSYFTEHIPAIMREVNSLYDVDGIFTNAWPPLGRLPECFCEQCKKLPKAGSVAYWEKFNERTVELWKLYDGIAKEKKKDNLFFANMGGSIHATPDLKKLGDVAFWYNCDNQGRGGDDTPIWGCALQGRVCQSIMKGRTSTNVTAAWSTGNPRWRNVAKSLPEARMWMNETLASGMVPWYHFIGGETGMGEDRRWLEPGKQYFGWMSRHDRHFTNKRTVANLGVVMGQRTHLFYRGAPGITQQQHIDGMYYALLEGRFLFDFVHEDDLGAENLKKYTALLLPNIAWLSDRQCAQLKAYAAAGGSLLATYETSLYNERGDTRLDFGLADVFGIHKKHGRAEVRKGGPNANGFYARIERPHEILSGFKDTHWLPGAEYRVPLAAVENPVLTVVPPYVAYPPELSYPPVSKTDEPAVVVRENGRSRLVWFPGDIERTMWKSGHTDLARLLQNAIKWVTHGEAPVEIEGDGVIESFAWETEGGFAVHLLNYTNPAMHRGWIRSFYPIGEQKVWMRVPAGRTVTRVELLRGQIDVPFRQTNGGVEFTVPRVVDYEVAALHA